MTITSSANRTFTGLVFRRALFSAVMKDDFGPWKAIHTLSSCAPVRINTHTRTHLQVDTHTSKCDTTEDAARFTQHICSCAEASKEIVFIILRLCGSRFPNTAHSYMGKPALGSRHANCTLNKGPHGRMSTICTAIKNRADILIPH